MNLVRTLQRFSDTHTCQYDWAEDCHCQFGRGGVVLNKSGQNYITAFFEAFPASPRTFIRGEGSTVAEAETQAWTKLQRILSCDNHEFERRSHRNGGGVCKHCNLFQSEVFEPLEHCIVCGVPTYHAHNLGDWYCKTCWDKLPIESKPAWAQKLETKVEVTEADIAAVLNALVDKTEK